MMQFKCSSCGYVSDYRCGIERHINRQSPCGIDSDTANNREIIVINRSGTEYNECTYCGYKSDVRGLTLHKNYKNNKNCYELCLKEWSDEDRTCKNCGLTFACMKDLHTHMRWCDNWHPELNKKT